MNLLMVNIENNVGWSPQAAGGGSYTEISGIFPLVCSVCSTWFQQKWQYFIFIRVEVRGGREPTMA